MAILGIDLGTTHLKAGVFAVDGRPLAIARRPTPSRQSPTGYIHYEPGEWLEAVFSALEEAIHAAGVRIEAVGAASTAESGLFVDRFSGEPLSPFLPWYDTSAAGQAETIGRMDDPFGRFLRFGIQPSFKVSLARILWLVENGLLVKSRRAIWLSAADYFIYRLTGAAITDPSLACRTYAYRIDAGQWDGAWLKSLDLDVELFPQVLPTGVPAGKTRGLARRGLADGLPASVCGHDHICASFAAGLDGPETIFDSIGTAETVTGLLAKHAMGQAEYESGLSFGCYALPGRLYWLGGLSTSGGAVAWMNGLQADPHLDLARLDGLLEDGLRPPPDLIFLPYMEGSGSPHTNQDVRGAFLGLDRRHTFTDLYHAVLAGTACEMEFIKAAGEAVTGVQAASILAAGGGAGSRVWLQIKANLCGCGVTIFPVQEATLLGAAVLAGVGAGIYPSHAAALAGLDLPPAETIQPAVDLLPAYRRLAQTYRSVQEPYRQFFGSSLKP